MGGFIRNPAGETRDQFFKRKEALKAEAHLPASMWWKEAGDV